MSKFDSYRELSALVSDIVESRLFQHTTVAPARLKNSRAISYLVAVDHDTMTKAYNQNKLGTPEWDAARDLAIAQAHELADQILADKERKDHVILLSSARLIDQYNRGFPLIQLFGNIEVVG